jgi:hypothetical protein
MRALLIVALAAGLYAWNGGYLSGTVDQTVLRSPGPDECAGKERCLVVYLAPWCPQCRKSGPLVNEFRMRAFRSRSTGFKVVLGQDEPGKLVKYASKVGGAVHYDDDGYFYDDIGASGVPAWISLDAEGHVLEKVYGRPMGAEPYVLADRMLEELDLVGAL